MSSNGSIRVIHYHRKPYGSYFSIERVFAAIRAAFPKDIECRQVVCRFKSRGVLPRLWNIVEAIFRQGQINHITGDVHFLAVFLRKRRTILTIHDCVSLRRADGIRRWAYKLVWYQMPMWRSSVVVAISEFTRRELEELAPAFAGKIIVIPDPVVGGFTPSVKPFDKSEPVILHIGTARHKNIERVAQALNGIRCRMEIIGNLHPEQEQALRKFRINYAASSQLTDSEIVEKYRSADIVEFCSTYEGFGMPVLEANASGRPVITSCIEPMVSVAGRAACLVDPSDPDSIRAGMLRIIEDPHYREELVRLGFENANRFSADTVAQAYAAVYRKLNASQGCGASK
jgi:glycosyltransferase involved in cell wall biosynthesis